MPGKKISKTALSRNISKQKKANKLSSKKIDLEEIPFATIRITVHALRWIFLLIFIYIAVSIVFLLIQGGDDSVRQIVVYSVTGFFTFFMGYFGWTFAQSIAEMMSGTQAKKQSF